MAGLPFLGITGLLAVGAIPGIADSKPERFELGALEVPPPIELAALPRAEKLWVKVRSEVSVEELSQQLELNETRLAKLNEVDEDHRFNPGDWLVLPSQQTRKAKLLASLDTSDLRRNPPIQTPLPLRRRPRLASATACSRPPSATG